MPDEPIRSVWIGDKEISYHPDFKLFLTTKLSNPHYKPEVCTRTTIVNFTVKERGLEDQLLAMVVSKEEPQLENDKSNIIFYILL